MCTWPDIAFTAAALGQYNAKPTHKVTTATKRVLHYLAGTKSFALKYGGDAIKDTLVDFDIQPANVTFSDSDWGSDKVDHRSFSGYAIYLYGGLVSWSSSKQKSTALSSTESEYMALTHYSSHSCNWSWPCLSLRHVSLMGGVLTIGSLTCSVMHCIGIFTYSFLCTHTAASGVLAPQLLSPILSALRRSVFFLYLPVLLNTHTTI